MVAIKMKFRLYEKWLRVKVWIMILISLLVVALVLTFSSMLGQGFMKWNSLTRFNDTIFSLTAPLTNNHRIKLIDSSRTL